MRNLQLCSWCHEPVDVTGPGPHFCGHCGHRGDVGRSECDCRRCVHMVVPDLLDIQEGDYPEPWPGTREGGAPW